MPQVLNKEQLSKVLANARHYHFIGIAGIGMSGIARIILRRGLAVSGSDLATNRITRELEQAGAKVYLGHSRLNIRGADVVVYSSAITGDNPEVQEAALRRIPVIRRAQALAELMSEKEVVTVAGSHGKTTVTSLVAYLLLNAGFEPTAAIGGILRNIDANVAFGQGEFFVAEADESDGSFLHYHPRYSIITNIDYEHMDYYKNLPKQVQAFGEFIDQTKDDGCLFCCGDDPNLVSLVRNYKNKCLLFGLNDNSHVYAKNIVFSGLYSQFDCYCKNPAISKDEFIGRFSLALAGRHNVSNSLAVIALARELGIANEVVERSLSGYKGAERRLQIKYDQPDLLVLDDYAHHPSEIKATLSAVRQLRRRIVAVFQPHRYTRTQLLLDEFSRSFNDADYIIVTDIYGACELPIEGINGLSVRDQISKNLKEGQEVHFLPKPKVAGGIRQILQPGDLVITLGAGDINKVCDELVEGLKNRS